MTRSLAGSLPSNAMPACSKIQASIRLWCSANSSLLCRMISNFLVVLRLCCIDHFNDLIKDKANHLGISIKEMEARLKSGDANLMSTLLATPFGLAVWDSFQQEQAQGN